MALNTVGDYVTEARTLLQDVRAPNRYASTELKAAIGYALMEARRLRPDLFPGGAIPSITGTSADGDPVAMDEQYRIAVLYYVVGHVMLREEEESVQQIARAYKQAFGSQLVSVAV